MMEMLSYAVQWFIETGFLLLALWIMARIQKLQFTALGLLVSAAIACAFDLIPFVGHYIAICALWVSLTKVTREDFTGVAFTAGISYALVFGMNLFLLGALMGELRPSVRARSADDSTERAINSQLAADDGTDSILTEPEPAKDCPTAAETSAPVGKPSPAQTSAASSAPPGKTFVIKGITQNGKNSMTMLFTGVKTYALSLDETVTVETPDGPKSVRLKNVAKNWVLIEIAGQLLRLPYPAPTQ